MDSLERQYQKYPFENTRLFNNPAERNTVFSRVDTLGQRDRLVGFAWCALKEAVYGPHANSLLLIDYELLTRSSADVMRLVYQFIDEPFFDHDFDHIQYDAPNFDHNLGVPGLHTVEAKVQPNNRKTILPPDLFDTYADMSFWQNLKGSDANIIAPER
jgi:sulfotransferase